jgi:hypothetical protein
LWNDQPEALRGIILRPENLPAGINLDAFVDEDQGSSVDLYRAYLKSLLSNSVDPQRNPLLYEIATSNVLSGCQKNLAFKNEAVSQVMKLNRKDLLQKLQNVLSC